MDSPDGGGGKDPPDISESFMQINENKRPTINYSTNDLGPYYVYIESHNTNVFSHLKIAREVFNLQLKDLKKIHNKGLNRVCVEFLSGQPANNFVTNKVLLDKGFNIYIPLNFTTCKGVIRQIDLDIDEEEMIKNSNSCAEVIRVKRLNRRIFNNGTVEYVPTGTCLFTFRGTIIPKFIEIFNLSFTVSVYIPPVTQCFACLLFGHTKKTAKDKSNVSIAGRKTPRTT